MMTNRLILAFLMICFLGLQSGCKEETKPSQQRLHLKRKGREVPSFSADSAFKFVKKQLSIGPRNPGSDNHRKAKEYYLEKLGTYAGGALVFQQQFSAKGYGKDSLHLANIVASFNPEATERIMLSAHWDTRPRADQDNENKDQPILGADDGASGVAVLLELARLFKNNPPPVGVDIILFDGEDYGREGDSDKYFMGSRYWSKHPPVEGYDPRFAILLDMVGGTNAEFPKERYSTQYAGAVVNEIWAIAEETSAGRFVDRAGGAVSDDHVIINRITGIPTIDIIRQHESTDGTSFAPYWHTHDDNIDIIDKH